VHQGIEIGGFAGLAGRVQNEIFPAVNEFLHTREPGKRVHHIMNVRLAGASNIEEFFCHILCPLTVFRFL